MIGDDELTGAIIEALETHSSLSLMRVLDFVTIDRGFVVGVPAVGLRLSRLATQGRVTCDGMVWRLASQETR
jgi:hypothetical protein